MNRPLNSVNAWSWNTNSLFLSAPCLFYSKEEQELNESLPGGSCNSGIDNEVVKHINKLQS